jgi:hypothetical protein
MTKTEGQSVCPHECGFGDPHQICQCVNCGHEWPNPEWNDHPEGGGEPEYDHLKGWCCPLAQDTDGEEHKMSCDVRLKKPNDKPAAKPGSRACQICGSEDASKWHDNDCPDAQPAKKGSRGNE